MPDYALDIQDLQKRYGDVVAVDGLTLQVPRGSIFCVVGPNGAGKTTTLEIAEGLTAADGGSVRVLGLSVPAQLDEIRTRVGVQLQTTALFERLTVRETISLYRAFYRTGADPEAVMDTLSLRPKAGARVTELSGGQQQRLAIALALVNAPELVFLDEPTASLDPQARRDLWRAIEQLRAGGTTVVFTTHYMDEAEKLSDEVAIIDRGKLIAQDTPAHLIRDLGRHDVIEFVCDPPDKTTAFEGLPAVQDVTVDRALVLLYTRDPRATLPAVVDRADAVGASLHDLRMRSPSLEDVFIERTGHWLRE